MKIDKPLTRPEPIVVKNDEFSIRFNDSEADEQRKALELKWKIDQAVEDDLTFTVEGFKMHEGLIMSYLDLYTDMCLDYHAKTNRNLNNLNLN